MWANSNGAVTLSQRQAPGEVMPTVAASPPRVATLSTTLSTSSGNAAFVYTIPVSNFTSIRPTRTPRQSLIFAFGTQNPGSSDTLTSTSTTSAGGAASTDTGGATDDIPLTPYQRMVVAHAILSVVGFALLLPLGALVARYLRTFSPSWFTVHWIAQFGISGPVIIVGIVLGFKASGNIGYKILDPHKVGKPGIVLLALYVAQCIFGAVIHWVKPKNATSRPLQNYLHAILGLTIIGLSMYQIRTGYSQEWPNFTGLGKVPSGVNILWMVWVVVLPVLYAIGLAFLPKQYRQENAARKG
ncbi:hypothetical protein C8F04DRAFT_1214393 [Mycena alexandri]|uniref:Cytochrome b561 domain-containing protein n=1 Tax=Mycena alexandri TaxID=1745969 RepID=A0AAD6S0Z3_9AGAR|nr:hypothetical protein C8F04DRAFT_1214393 [Mycena alexandri]